MFGEIMNYIIYFDENYKKFVEYEIGHFKSLSSGVGFYSGNNILQSENIGLSNCKTNNYTCNKCDITKKCNIYLQENTTIDNSNVNNKNENCNTNNFDLIDIHKLSSGFNEILNLLNVNKENLHITDVLENSIFVRFYHKIDLVSDEVDFEQLQLLLKKINQTTISIRVVYGLDTAFKGITQDIASYFEKQGYIIDVKNPQVVISIFAGDKLYCSVDLLSNLSSNYRAGAPHYSKVEEISRAEFKLKEAIEKFKINLTNVKSCIDLGASPGGWTHLLAKMGKSVVAVDPAELDSRIYKLSNVKHIKMLSQDYLKGNNEKFDMIVNDMKMFGDKSAHIVCNCVNNLNTNAILVMTIKLAEVDLYSQIIKAVKILNQSFNIISIKKLFHTRQEVIVYAKLKNTK